MLKVFLVEDEVVMRKGIKNNIPWEKEGFVFVGEASDGELAYPLIKKTKPDIRLRLLYQRIRQFPVTGLPHKNKAFFFPGYIILNPLAHNYFVFH